MSEFGVAVEQLLRESAPRVLGALVRRFGDFTSCEDAVQEAMIVAANQWPSEGVPENPRAWLVQVASRRFTDHQRSESARRRRESEAAPGLHYGYLGSRGEDEDDTLVLLFLCCHRSLTLSSAIALTLRAVGGLTTLEIAKAFLVPEATMAQRISRAKQTIKSSGVPFRLPTEPEERRARLRAALHVLYLIFNEGYTASGGGELHRTELSIEAIRLARILHQRVPADGDVGGLLALMLLTDARRAARTSSSGELIPLDKQDRTLWNHEMIREGVALLTTALSSGSIGAYQLQAAIAAIHDEAARPEDTDWPQILAFYKLLARMSDNPVVLLNQAVAVAMVEGPVAGLARLDSLNGDTRVAEHHRLDAVRAHLLELAGDLDAAAVHYRAAAARTNSLPERNYLLTQAALIAQRNYSRR